MLYRDDIHGLVHYTMNVVIDMRSINGFSSIACEKCYRYRPHFFVKIQKVMWIKRLVTGDQKIKWKTYFKYLMRQFGGTLIFYCNYSLKFIDIPLPRCYQEMMIIWLDVNRFIKKDTINKGNEFLFNNKYIHKMGVSYFNENLFLKNIYKIYHIVDEQGQLKSDTYFRCMGLSEEETSQIHEIFASIPEEWKLELIREQDVHVAYSGLKIEWIFSKKTFQFHAVCSNILYRACIQNTAEISTSSHKLQLLYDLSVKEVEKVFLRPRRCTLDNRLREFQYKLLCNIIYVNRHLYRFKFIPCDTCSFCGKDEETYQHIFLECSIVKNIWKQCGDILDLPVIKEISWKEVHIGIDGITGAEQLINHVILLIKYMLFLKREKKKPPTIGEITGKLLESKQEERKIATERKTLTLHYKKWEHLNLH